MYEPRNTPPIPRGAFVRRIALHLFLSFLLLVASLVIGILGYAYFENLSVVDGFINSSMLLGGMGPVDFPKTEAGKVFEGLYALYSGLGFLVVTAIMLTPIIHRTLHKFHWEE